ncbi:FxsB family cyclophane-forming radical SAM/SPASM peptide maturase [Catellatospora citrea]|uniref:FxsB family cyclophane-forming radical SAM/SPASM peptide maturase n=1 Tax=Catellatospora citrea TaxID=53366 RepID=UPI0033FE86C2
MSAPATPPWPPAALDYHGLLATGWRPAPLRRFVLKVHQRCNLACDYCYVYTLADQSWRGRPAVMPEHVWQAAVGRIAEHVDRHALAEVAVVLHGGEPLLAGAGLLSTITRQVRAAVPAGTAVRVGLQTNGVLLTERMLASLREADIRVGVSLDGTAADNDAHRRNARGLGSYAQVERALRLLSGPDYRPIYAGLLCTIDAATDPVATYEALLQFEPPAIDVLLPHANWATAGPRAGTPVADWLIAMFDRWFDAERQETGVRLFESVIRLLMGGAGGSDFVGLAPSVVAVVESDGAIEQTDALKSAYPDAAATGLSVLTDDFDAALRHPGLIARQIGLAALSPTCRGCELRSVCGGGHYAHRYRPGAGFVNPSVYCGDLTKLIGHVQRRLVRQLEVLRTGSRSSG